MSGIAIMFLTMPILLPTIEAIGFDPIWFGVLFAYCREIGMITPPVGVTLFAVRAVIKDVPTSTIIKGIVPFLISDAIVLSLLIAFPQISLFLPSMMKR